jgi:hypothetical protein
MSDLTAKGRCGTALRLAPQAPSNEQLLFVDLEPRLHQLELLGRQGTIQNQSVFNGNCRFRVLIPDVNMWQVMAAIVAKKHQYQNAVEHADGWHTIAQYLPGA